MKQRNSGILTAILMLQASAVYAQTSSPPLPPTPAPAPPAQLPKYTTTVPGTKTQVDIGAKPPADNPGKNITVSPGVMTVPGPGARSPTESVPGVVVTVPLGSAPKK